MGIFKTCPRRCLKVTLQSSVAINFSHVDAGMSVPVKHAETRTRIPIGLIGKFLLQEGGWGAQS